MERITNSIDGTEDYYFIWQDICLPIIEKNVDEFDINSVSEDSDSIFTCENEIQK